jgi:uncharacterized protein (DUF1697 family)
VRWVVLLRAVNLGSRNKVPMAKLRTLLEQAGYGDVRTYIASGNVLLDGPKSGAAVSRELERIVAVEFGVETIAIVRKPPELVALVSDHPFGGDTSRSHVIFLAKRPSPKAAERLADEDHSPDQGVLAGPNVYVQYGAGVQNARLSPARLEKMLGVTGTHRNWRTVAALAQLAAEA